jgi:8-oxo-dGTP diphosphatase
MPVVALLLRDDRGRLLLQQRPAGKQHAGLWEFPGGKVETQENPRVALCREIAEELGIAINPDHLECALMADDWPECSIVLFLYSATRWEGQITPLEGQAWGWFTLAEARELPMPAMDRNFIERCAH